MSNDPSFGRFSAVHLEATRLDEWLAALDVAGGGL